MAIGKTGAFATVQPIKDSIGEAMTATEDAGFKYRAEKRLEDEAKAKKEEKQLAEDIAWDGKFDPTIVGSAKIDDPMIAMAFKAKEEVGQIRRQLREPNLPYEEKVRLNSKLNKISQSFNVANQTPELILAKVKEIAKDIDKYDSESVNLIESIGKQLETGKYEAYYDENGTARIKIYKTDESGKPIGILKETTLGDIVNEFQPDFKSNFTDILKKEVDNTAIKESVVQNGFTTITNKKVDEAVKKQKSEAFGNLIANTPSESKYIAKKYGIDPTDKVAIAEKATEEFINALDSTYKKDIDQSGALAREKSNKEEQEKKVTTALVETPPEFTKNGIVPRDGYKTVSVTNSKPVTRINRFNSVTLDAYTVFTNSNNQRQIVALINYPDIKTSTLTANEKSAFEKYMSGQESSMTADEKLTVGRITKGAEYKKEVVNLNENEAYKFAQQMGYKDVNEMKDAAGSEPEKEKETPQQRIERLKKAKGLK